MNHLVLLPILIPFLGAVIALFLMRAPRWQGVWTLAVLGTAVSQTQSTKASTSTSSLNSGESPRASAARQAASMASK